MLEAVQRCCALGMELFSLSDLEDSECFFYLSKNNSVRLSPMQSYWMYAYRNGCNDMAFDWCPYNISLENPTPNMPLKYNFDNIGNMENCVQLSHTPTQLMLSDRQCDLKFSFICEMDLYKAGVADVGEIGEMFNICGKKILIGHEDNTETYCGARESCCSVGMKLISLDRNKLECLFTANKEEELELAHWFHTSARRNNVSGSTFEWCPSKLDNTANLWASGQPDNSLNGEYNTAKIFIDERTSGLNTLTNCKPTAKLRFICES